jgi:hypothetical protein
MVAALADPQLIIKTNKKPVIKIGIFVLELIISPLKNLIYYYLRVKSNNLF